MPTNAGLAPASSAPRPDTDTLSSRVFSIFLLAVLVSALVPRNGTLGEAVSSHWDELLFWSLVVLIVNLFPVTVGDLTLTLDMPVLIAVALLYSPEVAALVSLLAALDIRELRRRVSFSRAVFNRAQIGLSVFVAGFVFRHFATSWEPWPQAVLSTAIATGAFYLTNMCLVAAYGSLRTGSSMWSVLRRMILGHVFEFLATYLGYGVLALVLARLFEDVGSWSVIMFIIPLIVARQMFVRERKLQALTGRLRNRERLLERSFGRIVDERKDERLRIATDLHDDVLQSLIRITHLGSLLGREVPSAGPAAEDARQVVQASQETIQILRSVVGDLRKSPLGRGGLVSTLRGLAADLQLDWGTKIEVQAAVDTEIAAEVQLILYQVAREAVLNALKHSGSSFVRVSLWEEGPEAFLAVEDEGVGFDQTAIDESTHFGIGLIRERVGLAGGKLVVESSPQHGTRLWVCFPIQLEAVPEPRPIINRH